MNPTIKKIGFGMTLLMAVVVFQGCVIVEACPGAGDSTAGAPWSYSSTPVVDTMTTSCDNYYEVFLSTIGVYDVSLFGFDDDFDLYVYDNSFFIGAACVSNSAFFDEYCAVSGLSDVDADGYTYIKVVNFGLFEDTYTLTVF